MSNLGNKSNLVLASCAEQRQSELELKLRSRISALVNYEREKVLGTITCKTQFAINVFLPIGLDRLSIDNE